MRTITRSAVAFALAFLSLALLPVQAQAAEYFRYWAFFDVKDGAYVASQVGVGEAVPADGATQGYRWAAPADFNKPNLPRADLAEVTFEDVCGDTEPVDGEKRVAVVIDYGVEEDANGQELPEPEAACAQVPADATALQTLQDVAEVRTETGSFGPMLCGINGFPAQGCADEKTTTATPADAGPVDVSIAGAGTGAAAGTSGDEGAEDDSNVAAYAGLGVAILALAGAGFFLARRRNAA